MARCRLPDDRPDDQAGQRPPGRQRRLDPDRVGDRGLERPGLDRRGSHRSQRPGGLGIDPLDPNAQGGIGQDPNGAAGSVQPSIVAGSPAAQAGLQAGDIITAVDGTALDATHPLDLVMSQHAPGDTVKLDVLRNGQTTTVSVTLGTRPTTT